MGGTIQCVCSESSSFSCQHFLKFPRICKEKLKRKPVSKHVWVPRRDGYRFTPALTHQLWHYQTLEGIHVGGSSIAPLSVSTLSEPNSQGTWTKPKGLGFMCVDIIWWTKTRASLETLPFWHGCNIRAHARFIFFHFGEPQKSYSCGRTGTMHLKFWVSTWNVGVYMGPFYKCFVGIWW